MLFNKISMQTLMWYDLRDFAYYGYVIGKLKFEMRINLHWPLEKQYLISKSKKQPSESPATIERGY